MVAVNAIKAPDIEKRIDFLTPVAVVVTVWPLKFPKRHGHTHYTFSASPPQPVPIRFRALLSHIRKVNSGRLRLDLVYPLTPLPWLDPGSKRELYQALDKAIRSKMPESDICSWHISKMDTEYLTRQDAEG